MLVLVLDGMRADYLDRFSAELPTLTRLRREGAAFDHARVTYAPSITSAGHATIATGTFPSIHGVFQNAWFDRGQNAFVTCTEDAGVKAVSYGKEVPGSESGAKLLIPTFAEEMHRQRGAHVHVRVFSGRAFHDDTTLGKSGDLIFRVDEWPEISNRPRRRASPDLRGAPRACARTRRFRNGRRSLRGRERE